MRVQTSAKQMEESISPRYRYLREITEPCVWTDRMLTTLIKGVKRGKWYSLMDKLASEETLTKSVEKVTANKGAPGIDNVTVEDYKENNEHYNKVLLTELKEGRYKPQPVKRVYIPKPGSKEKRPLGIPTVRDRVTQTALRETIEVIFENEFSENSYGFRPQRSCKDALRRVNALLKSGNTYIVDADIRKFFDTIPHAQMIKLIEEKISDSKIIELIKQFLRQGIMEEMMYIETEEGTPQGGIISPLLANIYLDKLDKVMEAKGTQMVRYADDLVILCRNMNEAQNALTELSNWIQGAGLSLNKDKTMIVDMNKECASFIFLGYKFMNIRTGVRYLPCKKSLMKYKDKIRQATKRCNGNSMTQIIAKLTLISRGWFEYYKHSIKNIFKELDAWTRMRLRSILRKRIGGKGRGRGNDHNKWPNEFFEGMGFYSLEMAHKSLRQSISSNS